MPFFVKRNGQAVPIVSEPNVINDTTASQNTSFSGSKVNNLIANHTHASNQINAMTGYSKPSSTSNITPADSLNTAIGKVEKGLEGKQSPLSLGQYSGLDREIQILDNEEVGQTWYNTGVVDIEPSSTEGKLTVSKVDDSVFPGSAPYTSEDIDIPGWEKVENSPITVSATGADLTLSTSSGNVNALTVYGKSEVVDSAIVSAGEGWATVDLGTLTWTRTATETYAIFDAPINGMYVPTTTAQRLTGIMCNRYPISTQTSYITMDNKSMQRLSGSIIIKDTDYTDATAFKTAMSGVLLCYQLADPTQGNCIAVKTDNGTGINGTMATFSTGTPLRGVPDTDVRDVMEWYDSSGEVTKKCGEVDLGTLNWIYFTDTHFFVSDSLASVISPPNNNNTPANIVTTASYSVVARNSLSDKKMCINNVGYIIIMDSDCTDAAAFKTAMTGVKLVYELATPTTQNLTSTENASMAGLKTFEPTTHAQNNAGATMTVDAYAGTANGRAVTEIADKIDTLTPKVYSLFIAKTDWDETGTVEIDVPGTFGYDIPSENYNQLVLSDEQADHWRRFNVCLDHAHDASGYITTIEFSCDPGNIPDRPIYFNIVSSKSEYVDWSVTGNLIVPPGLQVDTSFDSDSTNPVQNKVITAALGNKADTSALNNYVEKVAGKSLSTNDYTDADKALVQDSPITVTATGAEITASTAQGNLNALTVYGKSEVVDGTIVSAGEGYTVVDLGTLTWTYKDDSVPKQFRASLPQSMWHHDYNFVENIICPLYKTVSYYNFINSGNDNLICRYYTSIDGINIVDNSCTTLTQFLDKINGVMLVYEEATPTNNTIAIKTDNGSGIEGTMAVFETGTPLRGIPDTTVRDVMAWDGSAGTVTKNCGEVLDLGALNWLYRESGQYFTVSIPDCIYAPTRASGKKPVISNSLTPVAPQYLNDLQDKQICYALDGAGLYAKNYDYTDATAFKNAMTGVMLVYELATPTTEQLTSTENASFAGLETYSPQTHAQNNAGAEMTIEAYAGTENGKAVNELKQDVQSEITALKITQSATLTLTTTGWTNNAQTVSYAHDTAKRNVIDVDPTSIEEWANCGILATAETATNITFTCKTVPTNALNFRVTSMGV